MKTVQCFMIAALTSLLIVACAPARNGENVVQESGRHQAEVALGIESVTIRLTSAGHMLDYRYRVLDPVLAMDILNRNVKPYLLHEPTGKVLAVPITAKVGPLRQSTLKPEAGRVYFMMFGNAGKLVQPGDQVTLIIGDQRLEHLTVE